MRLIAPAVPRPRRLLLGLDPTRWCRAAGPAQPRTEVVFPDWLYDESRVNDLAGYFTQMVPAVRVRVATRLRPDFAARYPSLLTRAAPADALIVADGTSCRHQIHDGSQRHAIHVASLLARHLR